MMNHDEKLGKLIYLEIRLENELTQPKRRIDEEQKFESTNLDLQEGLGFESIELTSSTLESTRGVLESTSTEHSLTGENTQEKKGELSKGDNFQLSLPLLQWEPYIGLKK